MAIDFWAALMNSTGTLSRRGWRAAAVLLAAGALVALPTAAFALDPDDDEGEPPTVIKPPEDKDLLAPETAQKVTNEATAAKVYVIPLRGELGHDVTKDVLERVLDDARREEPDFLVFVVDMTFSFRGKAIGERSEEILIAWDLVGKVQEMQPTFMGIEHNPAWKKKPKVVFWVRRALGAAAFLPMVCKDIYFTPDGRLGAIGMLDKWSEGRGDPTVLEKQRSLRLGWVNGMANQGGYSLDLVRGMARSDRPLSYDLVGGQPVYRQDDAGTYLLQDAFKRPDTLDEIVRLAGNDILTLDAVNAKRLGVSRADVPSLDMLMFELGVERNYKLITEKPKKIMVNYSLDLKKAESDFRKIYQDYRRIQVTGQTPSDRNRIRQQQIGQLNKMKRVVEQWKDAINPRVIQGMPADFIGDINIQIDRIKTQMRLDK
ncbi:hypothetical protein BH11PLA1_BH11PLA1_24480 [soil metagenome]